MKKHMTRRQILKAVGAGVFAMPFLIPARLWVETGTLRPVSAFRSAALDWVAAARPI